MNLYRVLTGRVTDDVVRELTTPPSAEVLAALAMRYCGTCGTYSDYREHARTHAQVRIRCQHEMSFEDKMRVRIAGQLSTRAAGCLVVADISTIGDLISLSPRELLSFRNLGLKTLAEIEDFLWDEYELRLRQDAEGISQAKQLYETLSVCDRKAFMRWAGEYDTKFTEIEG